MNSSKLARFSGYALILIAATLIVGVPAHMVFGQPIAVATMAPPSVRLEFGKGICSGDHLGGGRILTAAHCVSGPDVVFTVKTQLGGKAKAKALWASPLYDVALLQATDAPEMRAAAISCDVPQVGDTVTTIGNPLGFEFVQSQGQIASRVFTGAVDVGGDLTWQERVISTLLVEPGNSGGAAYNAKGRIAGVVVGKADQLSIIIPGSTVCKLLGR
jgi:S1-C subfamily serine protease